MGKKNSLWSLIFLRTNLATRKAGIDSRLSFSNIFTLLVYYCWRYSFWLLACGWPFLIEVGFWDHWGISFPILFPRPRAGVNLGPRCSVQFPCVFLRKAPPTPLRLSGWVMPAKQDWDHFINKLQGQKQICNYCDITVSSQCFSSLVFIGFRLWHERWSGRGFICSLTLYHSRKLRERLIHILPNGPGCPGKWQPGVGK